MGVVYDRFMDLWLKRGSVMTMRYSFDIQCFFC